MLRAVGETYAARTGRQVVAVRHIQHGSLTGYYSDSGYDPTPPRITFCGIGRRHLIFWQAVLPSGWWVIPITPAMRGKARGTVNRAVRTWLDENTRRGTVKACQRWEILPQGIGHAYTAVAFEDQTDAAMFRLSWL